MTKRKPWALMPPLIAGLSLKKPQGLGGNPRAFYGTGKRQHRTHRLTAAQRYHRARGV
jgi:hypothetical protein